MSDNLMTGVVSIGLAIVGVATLAVIFSKQAQTANVIQAASSGFGNALSVAVSPITGNAAQANLSYPSSFG
jgi:hypothetical protein